jgi:hypothetical protein
MTTPHQDMNMTRLLLASAFVTALGCTASSVDTQPDAAAPRYWLTECGTPPQIPPWSYTFDNDTAPTKALVPLGQWNAHVTWASAIASWSNCVDKTRF